jgi:hypothetical protein
MYAHRQNVNAYADPIDPFSTSAHHAGRFRQLAFLQREELKQQKVEHLSRSA